MEKTTLAFAITLSLLFNLIMLHAVLRLNNELQQRVNINSQQINNLIEIHYKE